MIHLPVHSLLKNSKASGNPPQTEVTYQEELKICDDFPSTIQGSERSGQGIEKFRIDLSLHTTR